MNFALRVVLPRIGSAVTLAAAVACVPSAAFAVYVVDTGAPPEGSSNVLANAITSGGLINFQQLGGSFALATAQTLTAVDGWISTIDAGDVTVSLWSGAPTTSGTPLFTTTSSLEISAAHWVTFGGLSWAVGPGIYSVTFTGVEGYVGGMDSGPPSPLSAYYFHNDPIFDWESNPLVGIGVRVSAVPEPGTYALMLAGFAVIGGAAARRRKA